MKIAQVLANEDVINTELRLSKATSENIIEILRDNLKVLSAYRKLLTELRRSPELGRQEGSGLQPEVIERSRASVLAAIRSATEMQNLNQALLDSFLLINGYEVAETFNRVLYKGSNEWEMLGGKLCAPGHENISIAAAVEKAGQLRREAYTTIGTTFFR